MKQFTVHTGTAVPLRRSNVDTDQIIPVRFLNVSRRTGHAASLFADWREDPAFVLGRPEHEGATILVAGPDFGTGSSREYAVWALADYGFRAVIAPRFGDIFRENALQNGLLPVELPEAAVRRLWQHIEADPGVEVAIDLQRGQVRCRGAVHPFAVEDHYRLRLLAGEDAIAATLRHVEDIAAYERTRRPALPTTTTA